MGLEFVQCGFDVPALVVQRGEFLCGGVLRVQHAPHQAIDRPGGAGLQRPEARASRPRSRRRRGTPVAAQHLAMAKESPARRPPDRLYRRIGSQRTADPGAHLGPEGSTTGRPVSLQLESCLGHRRTDAHQLSVPIARAQCQEGAGRRVSQGAQGHLKQALLILWDGARPHRSKLVRVYLDSIGGQIQIAFLPPYAPDLSPVEYFWA